MNTQASASHDVVNLYDRRADQRWNRVSVADIVERLTWSTPDKEALVAGSGAFADPAFERLTFAELDRLMNQVGHGLRAAGLQRGDRVLMVCENSVEGYAFKLGASKIGVVVAPLNPNLAPDVVRHLVDRVEPSYLVVDAELWPRVRPAFSDTDREPDVTIEIGGDVIGASQSFTDFVAGQPTDEPEATVHGDDIWEILFTSGTTAMPKGVMESHTTVTLAAHGFALTLTRGLRVESDVKVATFLPMMYHVGHYVFALAAFVAGGSVVLGRSPDPEAIARAIEAERVTALWAGSPAMVRALVGVLDESPRDVASLTMAVYGWAALPPSVLKGFRVHCPQLDVVEIFGQTESISCHRFWPAKWPDVYEATAPQMNYVGIPSPLLASRIIDLDGNSLEGQPGMAGEAVYRSPVIAAGYYKDEPATREAFRDGWFHSGDSCLYDNDGLRVMVDRYKDLVKSGGENVSTIRVESVVSMHPSVAKVAVVGLLDDRWGEAVTAVVVPADGSTTTEEELIAFARERLAGFETPKHVIFVKALPETVGGKVMKYKLREQFQG
ncbi:acyl-CoA synthetase [Nocardioides endophyticus]|uniref:Acyl-CoA synthetase n=1 Tax=Nocardioides endophyticus TaxID=1353775 RepID=A0ABP8YBL3_9ACTN